MDKRTSIKRYSRCMWMAYVAAVFLAMTIGFIIPGIIGVAGLNRYNDTLLYLGLIDLIFAVLFFTGWWSCQIECEDINTQYIPISRHTQYRSGSMSSQGSSIASSSTHQKLVRMEVTTVDEL